METFPLLIIVLAVIAAGQPTAHRVLVRFERRLAEVDGDEVISEDWVVDSASGVFDEAGEVPVTLPPRSELRGEVVFEVRAPDGRRLPITNTDRYTVEELDERVERIELAFEPAEGIELTSPADPMAGVVRRLKGQVIDLNGRRVSAKQVLLFAAHQENPQSADFQAVAAAVTDGNGRFTVDHPPGTFAEAYGQVLMGDGVQASAPIRLDDRGEFPAAVILAIETAASLDAKDGCRSAEGIVPRAPDEADLADRSGAFSQDLGGGCCIDFTKPDRVLEEFSYRFVVRTTDPVVKPQQLDPPEYISVDSSRVVVTPPPRRREEVQPVGGGTVVVGPSQPPQSRTPSMTMDMSRPEATAGTTIALDRDAIKALTRNPYIYNVPGELQDKLQRQLAQDLAQRLKLQLQRPPDRTEVTCKTPIDWDDDPTSYQACTIAHGHILTYKQQWVADGYSLGTLLHSLPLAPGQKRQIAIVDWERRESAIRSELLTETEQLAAELTHDRDINDIVNATLSETASGSSESLAFGAGFGHGSSAGAGGAASSGGMGAAGGVGGVTGGALSLGWGSSSAIQNASREVSSNALQTLRDRTRQSASAMRGRRSTVVQTVTQGERTLAQSETVANYNHCHAVTMQYFEVLRHLLVRHRLVDVQECLFIPLLMSRFTPDKALRWQEALVRALRDRRLLGGFAAIDRIANAYEGSGVPEGAYAEAAVRHLAGNLTLRFQFAPPAPREWAEDVSASWTWYDTGLNLGRRNLRWRGEFGMTAESLHRTLLAAAEGYERAFQSLVAPKLARQIVDGLQISALGAAAGRALDLDLTLMSDYRHDAPLSATIRMKTPPSGLARADVTQIRIDPIPSDGLPPGSRILVEGGDLHYRTDFSSGYFFRDARIHNDLTDTDGVLISTPLSQDELRRPREEDLELRRRLLEHLNDHIEPYHKAIWAQMSPDRRYMLLDGFVAPNSDGRSVASVVDNQVIGIVGNSLVMPVARGLRLDPSFKKDDAKVTLFDHYKPAVAEDPLRIALPTKGVYAEAVMGACNSCEHKEEDRFWRWEESPIPDSPTPILPLSTETRKTEVGDALRPTPTSPPIIAMQNAPAAPDPQGLAAALQLLGNPNVFRDLTGLEGNQRNAIEALKSSLEAAQQFGSEAADVAKTFGQYATNLGMQSATSQDMDRIQRSIQTARGQGLISDEQASDLTSSALRAMVGQGVSSGGADPRVAEQVLGTLRRAREQGAIDATDESQLARQTLERLANDGEAPPQEPLLDRGVVQEVVTNAPPGASVTAQGEDGRSLHVSATQTLVDFWVPGSIPLVLQDTNHRCWAAAAAMLLAWRSNRPFTARMAAQAAGRDNDGTPFHHLYDRDWNLSEFSQETFLRNLGLQSEPPISRDWEGFLDLMRDYGPLWIQTDRTPEPDTTHFVIVYGLRHDADATQVRILDPAGGRMVQEFSAFAEEYERIAFEAIEHRLPFLIQLAHWPRR